MGDAGDDRAHACCPTCSAGRGSGRSSGRGRCARGGSPSRVSPSGWPIASSSWTRSGNPTLAFLASGIEGLKVRVTAKAPTDAEADAILDEEEAGLRAVLGRVRVRPRRRHDGIGRAAAPARAAGGSVAVAESLTGGLVGSRLASVPGASDTFLGGVIAYDPKVKFDLLGVPEGPVVSEEAAGAMALGVRKLLGCRRRPRDHRGGRTGRPGGPSGRDGLCRHRHRRRGARPPRCGCRASRNQVREFAVISLLSLLRARLSSD